MKLPRIEGKRKRVEESPRFDKTSYFRGKPHLAPFVAEIYEAIESGKPLPDWAYRRDLESTPDLLLERMGVMHLHLGSKSSNELLYVYQFDDYVVFLEISSHRHFETDPPGTLLKQHHEAKVAELNERIAAETEVARLEAESNKRGMNAMIRKSLGFDD